MGKLLESMRAPETVLEQSDLDDRAPLQVIREVKIISQTHGRLDADRIYDPIPPRSKGIELPKNPLLKFLGL